MSDELNLKDGVPSNLEAQDTPEIREIRERIALRDAPAAPAPVELTDEQKAQAEATEKANALPSQEEVLKAEVTRLNETLTALQGKTAEADAFIAAAKKREEEAVAEALKKREADEEASLELTGDEKSVWEKDIPTINKLINAAIRKAIAPLMQQNAALAAELQKLQVAPARFAAPTNNQATSYRAAVDAALPGIFTYVTNNQAQFQQFINENLPGSRTAKIRAELEAAQLEFDHERVIELMTPFMDKVAPNRSKKPAVVPTTQSAAAPAAPKPADDQLVTQRELDAMQASFMKNPSPENRAAYEGVKNKFHAQRFPKPVNASASAVTY